MCQEFIPFLRLNNIPSYVYATLDIHSFESFHLLATVNNVALNISLQIPVSAFISFWCTFRNCWTIGYFHLFFWEFFFHSWFTYLYFHHQCTRIQFFYILANSFIFWQYSYPSTCEGVSHCIFICISLVISEVEHIFICFLATCTFFGDLLYRRQGSRPSPWKRNAKKQNGCLRRSYK